MQVFVTYGLTEVESTDISQSVLVAIDCFRASTSIVAALAAGAEAVYPFLAIEEAISAARECKDSVLAGERAARKIHGFDLGNSPSEFTRETVGGRPVMMTTTNGTRVLSVAAKAAGVFVGSFVNARATARAAADEAADEERDIVLATAGTDQHFSIEDALCAGMIAGHLKDLPGLRLDDSARFALIAYERARRDLRKHASSGRGAANLVAVGLEKDIDFCLDVDGLPIVARAQRDPLRVVRA